jgi:hypothetical protein
MRHLPRLRRARAKPYAAQRIADAAIDEELDRARRAIDREPRAHVGQRTRAREKPSNRAAARAPIAYALFADRQRQYQYRHR